MGCEPLNLKHRGSGLEVMGMAVNDIGEPPAVGPFIARHLNLSLMEESWSHPGQSFQVRCTMGAMDAFNVAFLLLTYQTDTWTSCWRCTLPPQLSGKRS